MISAENANSFECYGDISLHSFSSSYSFSLCYTLACSRAPFFSLRTRFHLPRASTYTLNVIYAALEGEEGTRISFIDEIFRTFFIRHD
jgi:hypothetical protein